MRKLEKEDFVPRRRLGYFILFAAVMLLIDAAALFLYYSSYISLGFVGVIHLFVVAVSVLLMAFSRVLHYDIRFPIILGLFSITLGPFGVFLALISSIIYTLDMRIESQLTKFINTIFFEPKHALRKTVYDRLLFRMDNLAAEKTVHSFESIMRLGSEKQKRSVLGKIYKYFKPEFTPALKTALQDESGSIRVLAATVMAGLTDRFFKNFSKLQKLVEANPNNATVHIKFAEYSLNFADANILSEEQALRMREKALEAFKKYEKINGKSMQTDVALGKIYLRDGQLKKSKGCFESALKVERKLSPKNLSSYMNLLFKAKEYKKIRRIALSESLLNKEQSVYREQIKELNNLWREHSRDGE